MTAPAATNERPVPNQSYLAKQMQIRLTAALAPLFRDLGLNVAQTTTPTPWEKPLGVVHAVDAWRIPRQIVELYKPLNTSGDRVAVEFKGARWQPGKSSLNYGAKEVAQNLEVTDDSETKIIRNLTDSEEHVAFEQGVDLTNSFSSSVTDGVTLDMSVEIASEQKVSGSYAGVTAEVSLSEKFGYDDTKSHEEQKESAEEGTQSEKIGIDFDARPGGTYLMTITKEHETTYQPFDINGIMDFDLVITPSGGHRIFGKVNIGTEPIMLKGVAGLEQFVNGYDTNHPATEGLWDKLSPAAKAGIAYVMNIEHRRITAKGTKEESLESNADYKIELLGDGIPEDLDHLEVVDAQDL